MRISSLARAVSGLSDSSAQQHSAHGVEKGRQAGSRGAALSVQMTGPSLAKKHARRRRPDVSNGTVGCDGPGFHGFRASNGSHATNCQRRAMPAVATASPLPARIGSPPAQTKRQRPSWPSWGMPHPHCWLAHPSREQHASPARSHATTDMHAWEPCSGAQDPLQAAKPAPVATSLPIHRLLSSLIPLAARCPVLGDRCWLLAAGCWVLGCWPLAAGCELRPGELVALTFLVRMVLASDFFVSDRLLVGRCLHRKTHLSLRLAANMAASKTSAPTTPTRHRRRHRSIHFLLRCSSSSSPLSAAGSDSQVLPLCARPVSMVPRQAPAGQVACLAAAALRFHDMLRAKKDRAHALCLWALLIWAASAAWNAFPPQRYRKRHVTSSPFCVQPSAFAAPAACHIQMLAALCGRSNE